MYYKLARMWDEALQPPQLPPGVKQPMPDLTSECGVPAGVIAGIWSGTLVLAALSVMLPNFVVPYCAQLSAAGSTLLGGSHLHMTS